MTAPEKSSPAPASTANAASPQDWRYPFPDKERKEITDPQAIYSALGLMDDGFFPLGVNGFPHGGVHFGRGTSARFDQAGGVRAIANGMIVAYKLDDAYKQLKFTQDSRWSMYSTGFVLVRHEMTMPPAPGSTGAQPPDETLTFFSLYMHLADWQSYEVEGALARPGWWPVPVYRIGNKEQQEDGGQAPGAFVCSEPKAAPKKGQFTGGQHVGFLPEGSEVTVGEKRGEWGHIKAITSGGMIAARSGAAFGLDERSAPWLQPDGDSREETAPRMAEGEWGWIYLPNQQATTAPGAVGTVVVPTQPIPVRAGTLLGQMGEYHDYERSTPLPPVPARQLLHLEVFAGDDLNGFIGKSRARAAQLGASGRTILVVDAGTKLVERAPPPDTKLGNGPPITVAKETASSPKTGPWIQIQTFHVQHGIASKVDSPVWIERRNADRLASPVGLAAWWRFPLQLSQVAKPENGSLVTFPRAQLDAIEGDSKAIDDRGVKWWHLRVGTRDGGEAWGWICEKEHPGTRWENPWAWPGFEIVDATGINIADAFRRNLIVTGSAHWKEQKEFEPSAEAVSNSALLKRLEQTVSRLPAPDGRKDEQARNEGQVVTARKLQQAMSRRWLASELSHVILRYESEWSGDMSRWEALTPLMRNAAENWRCELQRIHELQWWKAVEGKIERLPGGAIVNHIHPVALIGNFALSCFPLDKALEMALLITGSFEGENSTKLRYDAVANNFDGMGMSFGIVQWNFGMGTLGPVLLDMVAADEEAFKSCFDTTSDYESLVAALHSSKEVQKEWAIGRQQANQSGWDASFKKIGGVDKFNKIQLKHAATYNKYVMVCIRWLRGVSHELMERIEVQTYVALYDLCVQQQTLNSAHAEIKSRVAAEKPKTQKQLMIIVVEERSKKANPLYREDCLSRRRGILEQQDFTVPRQPKPVTRSNVNFSALKEIANEFVCQL
ncbi:lytic transglycosylase domain-containing protein [Burkholderia stagnalis]|uniref:Lytic transglycosylase domain-containing protein n=1 Tax=Burkholderia stagnalis TaxID=1503054 RepID=A0A6L3N6Y8_9BURK|nr:lytic transglycosylase domain-containing protein [Burkholderia stagnalis]KAB0641027.1 lytic transglycosylase domain-containing protein [Burkholderia stagnalis]VWB77768.1 calcium-binding protein [Burkholderia stagnalis]